MLDGVVARRIHEQEANKPIAPVLISLEPRVTGGAGEQKVRQAERPERTPKLGNEVVARVGHVVAAVHATVQARGHGLKLVFHRPADVPTYGSPVPHPVGALAVFGYRSAREFLGQPYEGGFQVGGQVLPYEFDHVLLAPRLLASRSSSSRRVDCELASFLHSARNLFRIVAASASARQGSTSAQQARIPAAALPPCRPVVRGRVAFAIDGSATQEHGVAVRVDAKKPEERPVSSDRRRPRSARVWSRQHAGCGWAEDQGPGALPGHPGRCS